MTPDQKAFCRELLALANEHGFNSAFPLAPIAEKLGLLPGLGIYDRDNESGLLYEFGDIGGNALLWFIEDGSAAGVAVETRDVLEAWSR